MQHSDTINRIISPAERLKSIPSPPIEPMMRRIQALKKQGRRMYSMAQAVPWYGPPPRAIAAFSSHLQRPPLHLYSPDPGLLSTRKALSDDFNNRRNLDVNPETELHLTCGASQAFLNALLMTTDPGDRVILIEPYYFDHLFTLQFCGVEADLIPMIESEGWVFPWDSLPSRLADAKALVLVNPGNPTGCALSESELKKLTHLTAQAGCALIIDETYERFNFSGSSWHPWLDLSAEHVITLGSFSKSFGISGWRLARISHQLSIKSA